MGKLALTGGTPVNDKRENVYMEWPQHGAAEMAALEAVLESGAWGTLGPKTEAFVKRFCEYQGAPYGVAVSNGTVSMEIALRALDIGYGDEVIIPPYSFYATASCVMMVGATPVFADLDRASLNLDPASVEAAITPRTKAIIPVHLGGVACDMDKLIAIAKQHGLSIIEDAAQANGGEWEGKKLGTLADAGSFSFQNTKNLTAGEGGFITLNDETLFERCWSIHNCGRVRTDSRWHSHYHVSTNSRITEWQAAVLDLQMNRVDSDIDLRTETADELNKLLAQFGFIALRATHPANNRICNYNYLFRYLGEDGSLKGLERAKFIKAVQAEGLPISTGYIPMYRQPVFDTDEFRRATGSKIAYKDLHLPVTEQTALHETIFFRMNSLMMGRPVARLLADAIAKVAENVDELL